LNEVVVSGTVSFGADVVPFNKATVYISLLDVSMQDVLSKTLAKQVIKDIKYSPDKRIPFSVKGNIEDERGMYVITVHVDVDGDGRVSIGDYITTGLHQISALGNTKGLNVQVQRVSS
jgi:putative lipoprotein